MNTDNCIKVAQFCNSNIDEFLSVIEEIKKGDLTRLKLFEDDLKYLKKEAHKAIIHC